MEKKYLREPILFYRLPIKLGVSALLVLGFYRSIPLGFGVSFLWTFLFRILPDSHYIDDEKIVSNYIFFGSRIIYLEDILEIKNRKSGLPSHYSVSIESTDKRFLSISVDNEYDGKKLVEEIQRREALRNSYLTKFK
jgi:hypothetical protein